MEDEFTRSRILPKDFGDPELNTLHRRMRETEHAWLLSYANRDPYEKTKKLVEEFIEASHAFQKKKHGKIVVKLNAARLLH